MTKQTNQQELPPKACTIDRLVTKSDDVKKVINGIKTATRRNRRYADIGEVMELGNHKFIVDNIYTQKLGELTDEDAKQEGFATVEEYKQSILSIHPNMPWLPDMKVCVHEFSRVE